MPGMYEHPHPEYDKEAIEAEQGHLQALQARQEIILKQSDLFIRGVAELQYKHLQHEKAFERGERLHRPTWEPPQTDGSDGTRVWVAAYDRSDPATGRTAHHLKMVFKIPDPQYPGVDRFQRLVVGEEINGLDTILPRGRFTNEDVAVVNGLLDEMRDAHAKGELPHLNDSLDDLRLTEPSSQEPPAAA